MDINNLDLDTFSWRVKTCKRPLQATVDVIGRHESAAIG